MSQDNALKQMEAMRDSSGNIEITDPFVEFLYILMRDYLRFGAVEDIIIKDLMPLGEGNHQEAFFSVLPMYISPLQIAEIRAEYVTGEPFQYANGWMALYAQYIARRIRGEIKI